MSQAGEVEKVKARIRALAEKTVSNGCTEAEALAAAEMVGRLLERYALSMQEIDVRAAECVQVEIRLPGMRRRPIDGCVPAIARFCDCKVWLARDAAGAAYAFFGFAPDTEMAAYLYTVVDRAMASEALRFKAAARLSGTVLARAGRSFQHGMAARLAERLEAMHQAREAAVGARRATGTALILIKHQVVAEAFRAAGVRLRSGGGGRLRINPSAYRSGIAAGDRINLERPVGSSGRALLG